MRNIGKRSRKYKPVVMCFSVDAVMIGRLDVVFCGIGLAVGFVFCVSSGRFENELEVVGVCFVEL